jgi:hypothetical protein
MIVRSGVGVGVAMVMQQIDASACSKSVDAGVVTVRA